MKPLPYIKKFKDRHGTVRYYYRRKGWPSVALPSPLEDMRAFLDAYAVAEGKRLGRASESGSLDALITSYLRSPKYRDLKPASKETYDYVIAFLRGRPSITAPVASIRRKHIEELRDEVAETAPGKANMVVKVLRVLMQFAVNREWRTDNPALRIDLVKGGEYRAWTDAELLKFEERWPRGTTERLIYELALGTGQRRGDIAKMTWADIKDGGVNVTQQKTGAKIWVPLHAALQSELARVPKRAAVLLSTDAGRSYHPKYLGTEFARAISAAGLPDDCVLHGLRKTAARRLAEAGASEREIMAITGHTTSAMVGHYVKQADQKVLAMSGHRKQTEHGALSTRVKPLKKD